jgi:hypothetical protein
MNRLLTRLRAQIFACCQRLCSSPIKVQVYGDTNCQVYGIEYRPLYNCLSRLPGVIFPRKPNYFWTGSGVYTEFVLRGHEFQIEGDPFDDALWISPKDERAHPQEIEEIRKHIERFLF